MCGWGIDKAAHRKVALVDLKNEGGLFANRSRIVGQSCFVGCSDFPQTRAARLKNFCDSKSAANLDQLATGDNNFGPWRIET